MEQQCELEIEDVIVTLKHGDITTEDVDAVVNLNNSSLSHQYGVSKAILEAGGAPLKEECKRLGKQKHRHVVLTSAGYLQCRHVAHMIGANKLSKITKAVKKVLKECERMMPESVAFPAVGTGISGVDPQESLKSILLGIREYLSGTRSTLQRINIVAFTPHVFQEYLKVMKDEIAKNLNLKLVINGTFVELVKGDITQQAVDCILNLTNSTLNRSIGVSGAILSAAGWVVAAECAQFGTLSDGVVVTSGGYLKSKHIMHVIGPTSVPAFAPSLERILMECKTNAFKTLALPAIGTGSAGMKPEESIEAILDGIERCLENMNVAEFSNILIIAYTDDVFDDFLKAFKARDKKLDLRVTINGTNVELVRGDITDQSVDCILNLTNSTLDRSIGVSGAILSAAGQTVVDECANYGSLSTDGVALTTGGDLQSEYIMHVIGPTSVPAFAPSLELILTQCQAMTFKTVALPAIGTGSARIRPAESINAILDGIERCLAHMNVAEFTDILIVAYDEDVYSDFLKAFRRKRKKSLPIDINLKEITGGGAPKFHLLESRKHLLKAIRRKLFGGKSESDISRLYMFTSSADLYGANVKSTENDVSSVQNFNLKLTIHGTIVELVKGDITEQAVDCIVNLTNSTLNRSIGVSGAILHAAGQTVADECALYGTLYHGNVVVTSGGNIKSNHIMHVISPAGLSAFASTLDTILTECKNRSFRTVALPAIGTGGARINPAQSIEAILDGIEESLAMNMAAFTKISIIAFDDNVYSDYLNTFQARQPKEEQFLGDKLKQLQECFQELHNNKFQHLAPAYIPTIQEKNEIQTGISEKQLQAFLREPDKWSPMDGQIHKEVELLRYSAEYKTVADKFTKSAKIPAYRIRNIKRIQNVGLWQKYSFNKFIVDQQYPGQKNEKHLYHGTDYSTAEKISLHGFNRAFCGKHGVSYGKGTYFAKKASYSCDDRYSVKDQNGEKHVYQAAVITGKWCQSDPIYVEPPPTAEDPKVLYNTTVDNVKYPTIFVVYQDNCAYPEYMITFTSS